VAKVTLKIGLVKARFNGTVMLDQSKAPDGFSLSGEDEGGLAGFAKGGADVTLTEDGETTILRFEAKAETGGKIAQLARLGLPAHQWQFDKSQHDQQKAGQHHHQNGILNWR
jgi:carbon monoxide dehydrogenase subunit G